MKCTTVLHGGVCHRTSTPHKSGNKMKERQKIQAVSIKILALEQITDDQHTNFEELTERRAWEHNSS